MWGLAFKPNTDIIREAQALKIVDNLIKISATKIKAYDTEAIRDTKTQLSDLSININNNIIWIGGTFSCNNVEWVYKS